MSRFPGPGATRVVVAHENITERKQAERNPCLSAKILGILNEPLGLPDVTNRILAAIKRETGFEAVGIRLRDGDDFPYFVQNGFSHVFLLMENTLIARDKNGNMPGGRILFTNAAVTMVVWHGICVYAICDRIVHNAHKGKGKEGIVPFLKKLARKGKKLPAVMMDMSRAYFSVVREDFSHVDIVYNRCHIIEMVMELDSDLPKVFGDSVQLE